MDINKLLKNITNVDEYISVTQEMTDNSKNTKVQINITTVLALKKIRSLEIEYLNKCFENGAACILFEHLLSHPPSKTWGVLGKELISLLQYWLEAIRKYLINHNVHWWSFLKLILKFIKEIRLKDPSIPNILVELTAECLFDISSRDDPDAQQRHEILYCLNLFCAESSREIRFAMRNKFGDYFTKLAFHLATSGYLPCQFSTLEALVRWLVPRQERGLRASSAARWFPGDLCPEAAREIFLNTTWMDFFQDARNFLNALNEANGLVTSVVCRKLTIGNVLIISGAEKQQAWLDINSSGKSISVLLDPRVLETFGVLDHRACETLMIADDNTQSAQLQSASNELTISLNTYQPPRVQPLDQPTGDASDVSIVVSSRVNLRKLDAALRSVFGEKYHLLMDLDTELSLSPDRSRDTRKTQINSEEDTRFSHPVEVKRRKHAGYIVRSMHAGGLVSPSTASTSSLAQLHDKLAALPRYKYEKEPVSVCAQPQLSSVTEISEADDRSFRSLSTLKFRPYGVCYKNIKSNAAPTKKKAESDSETLKLKPKISGRLSSVVSEENAPSCLLVATVGSADDSVINDTVERLSKSKEFKNDNIVDLLVQEALQAKPITKEKLIDSGIKSGDKISQEIDKNSETIDNTPIQDEKDILKKNRIHRKKVCTVISKSTTDDESNTEAINETPAFTNPKKSKLNRKQSVPIATESKADKQSFDIKTVEEFFSQHFAETKAGEIVISPSLAKKINETSSETSENFDENYQIMTEDLNANVKQFEFNDIDIIECLNDMVDKVCSDFEKCTEYLKEGHNVVAKRNDIGLVDKQASELNETHCIPSIQKTDPASKPKRNIKLTYKANKKKNSRTVSKKIKSNTEQNPTKKMSTIVEQKDEEVLEYNSPKRHIKDVEIVKMNNPVNKKTDNDSPVVNNYAETPVMKRKRKLYSPKDDEIEKDKKGIKVSETEDDDIVLSELKTYNRINTPKTTATCYKDIERERQKHTRLPRSRKCRGKVEESPSPRTLKMNAVFDKLKATVESKEKIILADKKTIQSDIYNFTSDSEDEDFKKKIEIKKRTSNTTIGSFDSTTSARPGRQRTRLKNSEMSSNDEAKNSKTTTRKKAFKKTNSKSKVHLNNESTFELEDERMRETGPELLNTSIVVDKSKARKATNVELPLHKPPKMEPITDDPENKALDKKKRNKKTKKAEVLSLKKYLKNDKLKLVSDKEDDRTVSPLPGLVVESMPTHKDDANDSVTAVMLQKFKKIYQASPDAVNECSNTQNMLLSDNEVCNYSPQNVSVNITDEICFEGNNKENIETDTKRKQAEQTKFNKKSDQNLKLSKNRKKIKTEKASMCKYISNEVIEICEIPDVKSEKSIATVGITAHGDLDEAPPSPEMIRQHMQPREIEDLNESMRDYFVKLNRELYNSTSKDRRESSKSQENVEISKIVRPVFETSPSVKSPVVSIKRLSFDDISKWLPSRRTSDTDSSGKSSPNIQKTSESIKVYKESKSNFEHFQRKLPENKNVSEEIHEHKSKVKKNQQVNPIVGSPKVNSPVSVVAISLEEFNNWLPMPKSLETKDDVETNVSPLQKETRQSSVTLVYNTRQKSKAIKDIKMLDLNKGTNTKKLKSKIESTQRTVPGKSKRDIKENATNTSEKDSDLTSDRLRATTRNKTRIASNAKKTDVKVVKNTNVSDSESYTLNKRSFERNKTVISPIKSFEDFVTNIHKNNESDDDHCAKKSRETFSTERVKSFINKDTSRKTKHKTQSPDSTSIKIKFVQSQDSTRNVVRTQDSFSTNVKEIERHESISTKMDESSKCPMKRRSSPILGEAKKMRFEANVETVTIESGPSISSVNDWFRRMEPPRSHENDTSLSSFRDMIHNIMEKLDTTLVENNRNTSKKLVNLFVEAQTQLANLQEERRKTYKTVAAQIITEMVSIMDEKFADLDRRSQGMDTEFKEQLKKQAFDLIREDCNQKRVMVLLLKEDVQAVFDHIERSRASP